MRAGLAYVFSERIFDAYEKMVREAENDTVTRSEDGRLMHPDSDSGSDSSDGGVDDI